MDLVQLVTTVLQVRQTQRLVQRARSQCRKGRSMQTTAWFVPLASSARLPVFLSRTAQLQLVLEQVTVSPKQFSAALTTASTARSAHTLPSSATRATIRTLQAKAIAKSALQAPIASTARNKTVLPAIIAHEISHY